MSAQVPLVEQHGEGFVMRSCGSVGHHERFESMLGVEPVVGSRSTEELVDIVDVGSVERIADLATALEVPCHSEGQTHRVLSLAVIHPDRSE